MADYEVKVTPVIEVDMDKLKDDVRGLSSVINKAAKGKLKLELDTAAVDDQLRGVNTGQVEIIAKLDTRSVDAVEAEIKKRLQRVQDLADTAYEFDIGSDKTENAFREQAKNLALIEAEYKKLIHIKSEYDSSTGTRTLERAEIRELEQLGDLLKGNKDYIKELRKSFAELFDGRELKMPKVEMPIGLDDAEVAAKVRRAIDETQRTANENPVNLDINMDEAKRKANNFISEIKNKVAQLDAIVVPHPTSRDVESASHLLARQMYGNNLENYSDVRYSTDVIEIYKQKAVILREITSLIQEMDRESQQALDNEIKIFQKLERTVPHVSSKIKEHREILAHLSSATDVDMPDKEVKVNISVGDETIRQDMSDTLASAQNTADSNPIILSSAFAEGQLDTIINNIIKQGEDAQRRLDELGVYKMTKKEIGNEAARTGGDFNTILENYKAQNAYSATLTKQLKEERREREELLRVIEESKAVLSDKIEFTDWGLLQNADPSVTGKAFNEHMWGIRELKQEAQQAEEILLDIADGMKKYSMQFEELVSVKGDLKPKSDGTTSLQDEYEQAWETRLLTFEGFAKSVEELEQRYYGAIQGRVDYNPSAIVATEIGVTQDELDRLISIIDRYNKALQDAGSGVTNAFGNIDISQLEFSIDTSAIEDCKVTISGLKQSADELTNGLNTFKAEWDNAASEFEFPDSKQLVDQASEIMSILDSIKKSETGLVFESVQHRDEVIKHLEESVVMYHRIMETLHKTKGSSVDSQSTQGSTTLSDQNLSDVADKYERLANASSNIEGFPHLETLISLCKDAAEELEHVREKLAGLGAEKITKVELREMEIPAGFDRDSFAKKLEEEGVLVERMTAKLKAERDARVQLNNAIQDYASFLSGNINVIDSDAMLALIDKGSIEDVRQALQEVISLQAQARYAQQEIQNLMNGTGDVQLVLEGFESDRIDSLVTSIREFNAISQSLNAGQAFGIVDVPTVEEAVKAVESLSDASRLHAEKLAENENEKAEAIKQATEKIREQAKEIQSYYQWLNAANKVLNEFSLTVDNFPELSSPAGAREFFMEANRHPDFDVIGVGNTGAVYQYGEHVFKNFREIEAEVYTALRGMEGIAGGLVAKLQGVDKIQTDIYDRIVSTDVVRDERERANYTRIIADNYERIIQAVSAMSSAGYSYNDPLQFGLSLDSHKMDLLDFSNVVKRDRNDFITEIGDTKKAFTSNLGLLRQFFDQFGLEGLTELISRAQEFDQLINTSVNVLDWLSGEERALRDRLTRTVGDTSNIYYSNNARTVGIQDAHQFFDEQTSKNFVFSKAPILQSDIDEWELKPIKITFEGHFDHEQIKLETQAAVANAQEVFKQAEVEPIDISVGLNPIQVKELRDSVQFIRDTVAGGAENDAIATLERRIKSIVELQTRLQGIGLPDPNDSSLPDNRVEAEYQNAINGYTGLQESIQQAIAMINEFSALSGTPLSLEVNVDGLSRLLSDAQGKVSELQDILKGKEIRMEVIQPENVQPDEVQVRLQIDSTSLDDYINSIEPLPLGAELKTDESQIQAAYENLKNAFETNNAILQEVTTQDEFKAKYESVLQLKEALRGLIGLYDQLQYGQEGSIQPLSDAGVSEVDLLRTEFIKVNSELANLRDDFVSSFGDTIVPVSFDLDESELSNFSRKAQEQVKAIFDIDIPDFEKIIKLGELDLSKTDTRQLNSLLQDMNELYGGKLNVEKLHNQFISSLQEAETQTRNTVDSINEALGDVGSVDASGKSETSSADELNTAWKEHSKVMEDANAAEQAKIKTSTDLGNVLAVETEKVKGFSDALDDMESKPFVDADLSGIKFDTRNIDINELQKQLSDIFNQALQNQDSFKSASVKLTVEPDTHGIDEITRAIATFKDGAGTTVQQVYGLVNVAKSQAQESAAEAGAVIEGMAEEAERQFQYLRSTMSVNMGQETKFNAEHKRGLAEQQIKTLEGQAKGLNLAFDEIKKAASEILDESSMAVYISQWEIMKEKIKTAKAELQSVKQLDTVAAMQRKIDGFAPEIDALIENVNRLKLTGFQDVEHSAFSALDNAINKAKENLESFKSTEHSMTPEIKVTAFDELIRVINDAKGQYAALSNQQRTHSKELSDYLKIIAEASRLQAELNKLNISATSDTTHVASVQGQLAIVNAKQAEYEAIEKTKFSELELLRIQEARAKATERIAKAAAGSSSAPVTPKTELDLQGFEGDIRKLEMALSKIVPQIDVSGFQRATEEIKNVHAALETLKDTNGTERQSEAQSRLQAQLKITKQSITQLTAKEFEIRGISRLRENIDQLDSRLNKMEINWSAFKGDPDLEQRWTTLKQRVDEVRDALVATAEASDSTRYHELNKAYQELNNSVRTFASDIQGAGVATKSFADRLAETTKRLAAYLVSFFSFQRVISLLRQGVSAVREIDKAMTALRRVTDETADAYDRFLVKAYQRAQRLGTSVSAIITSTADFARLGLIT